MTNPGKYLLVKMQLTQVKIIEKVVAKQDNKSIGKIVTYLGSFIG